MFPAGIPHPHIAQFHLYITVRVGYSFQACARAFKEILIGLPIISKKENHVAYLSVEAKLRTAAYRKCKNLQNGKPPLGSTNFMLMQYLIHELTIFRLASLSLVNAAIPSNPSSEWKITKRHYRSPNWWSAWWLSKTDLSTVPQFNYMKAKLYLLVVE